jgi:sirohydrochlorin ferrochelatase
LMDNGSLEPESTLQLRRIAAELDARLLWRVDPVSLAHSAKVPLHALNGRPAELFEAAVDRGWREGVNDFLVLPLFVGPSHAIVRHVPALLAERKKKHTAFRSRVAPPLFVPGETRLAQILADHIREQLTPGDRPRVAIVDHGSPNPEVSEVRNIVATQVRDLLGDEVLAVEACSMERREGAEYDFNEPLLANILTRSGWKNETVVVGMLFIAPGRHAGQDGDVIQICRAARGGEAAGVRLTRLLGQHPLLLDILADRASAG